MDEHMATILVVDDVAENIDILNNLLRPRYRIKAARSGPQALQVLEKFPDIDMVLLDVMMPEMDGYEVIRRLKADPRTREIPVIFITARGEAADETLGFELGAADYITKPISPPVVKARIATHLALREQRQNLERRVEEETSKRLEQERRLMRHSRLAAMGEMMSAITHQWNQPLNVISTTSANIHFSALAGKIEEEKLFKFLDVIDASVRFMSQTMLDFKGYFRPDKERKRFSVAEEAGTIVSMLAPLMRGNNIRIELDIDAGVDGYGVPSEFKQVVLNLLGNARDAILERAAGEPGLEGRIVLKGRREGALSRFEISDNGSGIPGEILEQIFDDYFTTKREQGTGIGLTMSKMIVEEQMGGTISARNGAEEGAVFVLEFAADAQDRSGAQ